VVEGEGMKERPILFSGWGVRAILAGTKTQTRRLIPVASRGGYIIAVRDGVPYRDPDFNAERPTPEKCLRVRCPYGVPGDRLWVRETHYVQSAGYVDGSGRLILYRATEPDAPCTWTPSIHMVRWASRITLEIEQVRVQRVQDISEEDAIAEGAEATLVPPDGGSAPYREGFRLLWDSINGPGAWQRNDWLRAVTFRRLEGK